MCEVVHGECPFEGEKDSSESEKSPLRWHEELKEFVESQDVLLPILNSLAYSNHLEGELHDFDEKWEDLEWKCETINKELVKLFISSKIEGMSSSRTDLTKKLQPQM